MRKTNKNADPDQLNALLDSVERAEGKGYFDRVAQSEDFKLTMEAFDITLKTMLKPFQRSGKRSVEDEKLLLEEAEKILDEMLKI